VSIFSSLITGAGFRGAFFNNSAMWIFSEEDFEDKMLSLDFRLFTESRLNILPSDSEKVVRISLGRASFGLSNSLTSLKEAATLFGFEGSDPDKISWTPLPVSGTITPLRPIVMGAAFAFSNSISLLIFFIYE